MALSPLGIVHTILGTIALFSAIYLFVSRRHIDIKHPVGKLYVVVTLLTAGTSLGIFNHGSFNIAHGLAVLTILAALFGAALSVFRIFGRLTRYLQLTALSSTLLFHLIPAATEIMTRFPSNSPMASSIQDPLLLQTFLGIFVAFLLLLFWQYLWLRKQTIYF
ncbi:MAG: hypothetical protein ACFHVJ_05960 [Aestuariibacter sp.]